MRVSSIRLLSTILDRYSPADNRYVCTHASHDTGPDGVFPKFQTWSALQAHHKAEHLPTCSHVGAKCFGKTFASNKKLKRHNLKYHVAQDEGEQTDDTPANTSEVEVEEITQEESTEAETTEQEDGEKLEQIQAQILAAHEVEKDVKEGAKLWQPRPNIVMPTGMFGGGLQVPPLPPLSITTFAPPASINTSAAMPDVSGHHSQVSGGI